MKRLYIQTIFFLLITLPAYSQDSLLVKANQQYADGKYETGDRSLPANSEKQYGIGRGLL